MSCSFFAGSRRSGATASVLAIASAFTARFARFPAEEALSQTTEISCGESPVITASVFTA